MNRSKMNSIGARTLLALALGAAALLAIGAVASAKDSNDDHIPDRWEVRHHLSLKVDQSGRDQDRDSLRNRAEFRAGDNPRDRDSDDDGTRDGDENAGTIASFNKDSGRLVIDLFGGDSVSGTVNATTEIKCEGPEDRSSALSGEPEPGDDHGGHGNEPGDDNGGRAGDDDGGHHGGRHGHVNCTTAALVVGAVVEEADLEIEHGTATFDEVELAHSR
jgi:hypothetical protein